MAHCASSRSWQVVPSTLDSAVDTAYSPGLQLVPGIEAVRSNLHLRWSAIIEGTSICWRDIIIPKASEQVGNAAILNEVSYT